MNEEIWTKVDKYLVAQLAPADDALTSALEASDAAGLPQINVAPNQGKLLTLLAKMMRATRILEIGTLGGYSTIWLARSLPSNGTLVSLELEAHHADVARANLERAGLDSLVEVIVGPATASLQQLIDGGTEPFDFIFIDADKEGYPEYLALSLQLARAGTVIVADNVVRDGEVIDAGSSDSRVHGVRAFLEEAAANSNLDGTAVQTVGSKGYDGFALLLVTGTSIPR
jgi:predicted O-methyltransferase YrrM